jgi:hypothetical protein
MVSDGQRAMAGHFNLPSESTRKGGPFVVSLLLTPYESTSMIKMEAGLDVLFHGGCGMAKWKKVGCWWWSQW